MTPSEAYAVYAAIALAFVATEVVARNARRGRLATFADVVSLLLCSRVSKAVVLTGWLWLGWHLFVRATHG